jgi:hypothetical protein
VNVGGDVDPLTDNTGGPTDGNHLDLVLRTVVESSPTPSDPNWVYTADSHLNITAGAKEAGAISSVVDVQYGWAADPERNHGGFLYVQQDTSLGADSIAVHQLRVGIDAAVTLRDSGSQNTSVDEIVFDEFVVGVPSGSLDLNKNILTIGDPAMTEADLKDLVEFGRNGGTYDGPGITSSMANEAAKTALGYADDYAGKTDPTSLRAMVTYQGDADLSRKVDLVDFQRLVANWQQTGRTWDQGNFDWNDLSNNEKVDLSDFQLLVANWQKTYTGGANVLGGVPEPATIVLLGLGGVALLRRRRRS